MLTYPLCDKTVTLYRQVGDAVQRWVLEGCYYRYMDCIQEDRFVRKFVLFYPGKTEIRPGDRIFDGIGPERVVWAEFLPIAVAGLSQADYAAPWYWEGKLRHWEAGRK